MYFTPMNILIRLPNWLGDMVMSTAFVQAVKNEYPNATIDLITKKGIDLLPILLEMILWSDKYLSIAPQAKEFAKMIRKDKDGLFKNMSASLKK